MKKLLIVAAVAMAAIASNAAAVTWSTGGLAYGGATLAKETATGYLWIITSTAYDAYSSYTDGEALSKAIYDDYKDKLGDASASALSGKKGALPLTDGTEYSAGDSVYAVVLYTTTQGGTDYFMGNAGYVTLESAQDKEVGAMATFIGGDGNSATSYATAWSTAAVPEPTSCLLMLLGMARPRLRFGCVRALREPPTRGGYGLALRRRRA